MEDRLAAAAARFVSQAKSIADALDAAVRRRDAGIEPEHWPVLSSESTHTSLHRLGWDLRAACDHASPNADAVFAATVSIIKEIDAAAGAYRGQRDLAPWDSCRTRVRELLEKIQASCENDGAVAPSRERSVVGSAPASAAAPTAPARDERERWVSPAGEKGETGENPPDPAAIAENITNNGRRILRHLFKEGADRKSRKWKSPEILDSLKGLSDGKYRRAMESLRKKGLYMSGDGQDGGVWLTPLGVAVAQCLCEPRQ